MAAIDDLSKATTTYFAWQTGATIYGLGRRWRIAYVSASLLPPIADSDLLSTWIAFWSLGRARPEIAAQRRAGRNEATRPDDHVTDQRRQRMDVAGRIDNGNDPANA